MKINLHISALSLVGKIASLPDELKDFRGKNTPDKLIEEYLREIKSLSNNFRNQRDWVYLRRCASYLHEFLRLSIKEEYETVTGKPYRDRGVKFDKELKVKPEPPYLENDHFVSDPANVYRILVKYMRQIQNQSILENTDIFKMTLDYGLIYLADYELKLLLKARNRHTFN